jgi:uncharacterized protein with von Willebrand factor type A (vWA) domain
MLDAAVAFGRILRGAGLRAGTDRLVEFARALEELVLGGADHARLPPRGDRDLRQGVRALLG